MISRCAVVPQAKAFVGINATVAAKAAAKDALRMLLYYLRLDNLTHSLFALTLSRTRLASAGRGTTAALLLASNAPDIDIVTLAGGTASYLKWHRGPTHG